MFFHIFWLAEGTLAGQFFFHFYFQRASNRVCEVKASTSAKAFRDPNCAQGQAGNKKVNVPKNSSEACVRFTEQFFVVKKCDICYFFIGRDGYSYLLPCARDLRSAFFLACLSYRTGVKILESRIDEVNFYVSSSEIFLFHRDLRIREYMYTCTHIHLDTYNC